MLAADGAAAAASLLGWLCERGMLRQYDAFWSYGYDTNAQAALLCSGAMIMHPDPLPCTVRQPSRLQSGMRHAG